MALITSSSRGIPPFRSFSALSACLGAALALLAGVDLSAASLAPGATPCLSADLPEGYGSFLLVKQSARRQTGADTFTAEGAVASIALVPPAAYTISNAIVSGPGTSLSLTRAADGSSSWSESGTEAAVLSRFVAGAWNTSFQLGFTNGDAFIGFFPFLLASNVPPLPTLANFPAAQSVDARSAFTVSWNPWIGAGTNDRVHLTLTDSAGALVVSASTDCAGTTNLAPGATGFEIPAGRLSANTTYTGHLTFGASLLAARDDSTLILERAFESRTTRFTLQTTPSSGGGNPGTFLNPAVSGTNLVFTLKGTAGDVQRIESTTGFVTWAKEVEVTLPATGTLLVTLPLPSDGLPRFYRAVAVGGSTPEPEVDPATLRVVLSAPRELDVTVSGTPGATYNVERTTDGLTWTQVGFTVIPADGKPQVVYVSVPEGANFIMVRAVSRVATPPVELKAPTLSIAPTVLTGPFRSVRLTLTGGTPRKNYSIQQLNLQNPAATWVNISSSISTDVNGRGTQTVPVQGFFPGAPTGGTTAVLYRAFIR